MVLDYPVYGRCEANDEDRGPEVSGTVAPLFKCDLKFVTTSSDIQISVVAAANIALDRSDVEVSAASISLSAGGDDMRLGGPPVQTVPARPRLATSKILLLSD